MKKVILNCLIATKEEVPNECFLFEGTSDVGIEVALDKDELQMLYACFNDYDLFESESFEKLFFEPYSLISDILKAFDAEIEYFELQKDVETNSFYTKVKIKGIDKCITKVDVRFALIYGYLFSIILVADRSIFDNENFDLSSYDEKHLTYILQGSLDEEDYEKATCIRDELQRRKRRNS